MSAADDNRTPAQEQWTVPPPPPASASVSPPGSLLNASLRDGWEAFKHEPAVLIGFFVLKIFVSAVLVAFSGGMMAASGAFKHDDHPGPVFFWISVFSIVDGIFATGILYAALRAVRRQPIPFDTFVSGFGKFLPVAVGLILVHLIVGTGLIFLIVPGIIFGLGFAQWSLLVMDRGMSAPEALSRSWALMRGYKAEYFLLWLLLIAINLAGALPLGFGLVITVPLTYATQAAFYDWLIRMKPGALVPAEPVASR